MPLKNPDETRTVELSLRELSLIVRLLGKGGTHPMDDPKWQGCLLTLQDKVLNAFGDAPVPTCSAEDATREPASSTCDAANSGPADDSARNPDGTPYVGRGTGPCEEAGDG